MWKFFTKQEPPIHEEELKVTEVNKIVLIKLEGKEKAEQKLFYNPSNFQEYIGQEKIKSILSIYIKNTKERNLPFPHTLIQGRAGMGKTTLAKIIAKMLGKELVEIISSSLPKDENILQEKIKRLNGKILFIDEIHSLPRKEVETIYTMMESFTFEGSPITPFTLIGATTEMGEIIKNRKPFYDRFKLPLELEDYTKEELILIAKYYKKGMFPNDELKDNNFKLIAENCRNTPRIVIRLIESTIYCGNIKEVLKNFGIIYRGFNQKDLKLLDYLSKNKIVGLQGLSAFLDTSKENYLYEIEPYLIKTGTIIRSPRGRGISDYGRKILLQLKEKSKC
jgi:holliday junction DNA helicase RuvB